MGDKPILIKTNTFSQQNRNQTFAEITSNVVLPK